MMHSTSLTVAAVAALALLAGASAQKTYSICSENSGGLSKVQELATALNAVVDSARMTFNGVDAGNTNNAYDMMRAGTCNVIELDGGKSFGAASDPSINARVLGLEGSGSYVTMGVARQSKLTADNINTFCDIIEQRNWRACHTGFMKSAGWLSPMIALAGCAAEDPTVSAACSDLTQTGEACHDAAFSNSCVPGMVGADGEHLTGSGAEICAACTGGASGDCDVTDLGDYYGAAQGLVQDDCDIAFVKTATIECPEEGQGFCKSAADAECVTNDSCDSKSVYERGVAIEADTYVRVPGYGVRVPAHAVVAAGMTSADAEHLMRFLPDAWESVHGKELQYRLGDDIHSVLGADFVNGLENVPYVYENFGLERPGSAPAPDDSGLGGAELAAVIVGAVALIVIVALCIIKGPAAFASFKQYSTSTPVDGSKV